MKSVTKRLLQTQIQLKHKLISTNYSLFLPINRTYSNYHQKQIFSIYLTKKSYKNLRNKKSNTYRSMHVTYLMRF